MAVYGGTKPTAVGNALRKFTSLDPQETSLTEDATEFGLGFVPVLGQAMALRDFERARRADDKVGMGLATASVTPFGKIAKMLRGKKGAVEAGSNLIGGHGAYNAPKDALYRSEELARKGLSKQDQWDQTLKDTGNRAVVGHEGQAMFEIPNSEMELIHNFKKDPIAYDLPLSEVIRFDKAFEAYPRLADKRVSLLLDNNLDYNHSSGMYLPKKNKKDPYALDIEGVAGSEKAMKEVIGHEMDHGVADLEHGFSGGANDKNIFKKMYKDYNKLHGKNPSAPREHVMRDQSYQHYRHNIGEDRAWSGQNRMDDSMSHIVPMDQSPLQQSRLWHENPAFMDEARKDALSKRLREMLIK